MNRDIVILLLIIAVQLVMTGCRDKKLSEQERKEAELQFRNEVSTFAIQIAEKLLREHMADEKAQSQLVDKLLDEIETKN